METAYLGVGGNLGDIQDSFRRARDFLVGWDGIHSLKTSPVFSTTAVGQNAGPGFLNAAFEVVTSLSPMELFEALMQAEQSLQRRRKTHWGPRTIDLDLVLYGDAILEDARLIVPHPAAWYRRFVLDPICALNPNATHPVKEKSIQYLKEALSRRPLRVLLLSDEERIGAHVRDHLKESLGGLVDVVSRRMNQPEDVDGFAFVAWNLEQKLKVSSDAIAFEDLPVPSRLDVGLLMGDAYTSLADVIKAATDEPVIIGEL